MLHIDLLADVKVGAPQPSGVFELPQYDESDACELLKEKQWLA